MAENILVEKSYKFSLRTIKLYQYLCKERKEYHLSTQVLRSGTSIGANIEEGQGGQSKRDFIAKYQIAYKEARETRYWLKLLRDSELLPAKLANSFIEDCEELLKLLVSILKKSKEEE